MPETPVVLITGASSGIGRATALGYADKGAHLVLLARSARWLEEVQQACIERGAKAEIVVADVLDAAAVQEGVDLAVQSYGRLDVCVHCAAVVAYGRLEEVPPEVWDRAVQTGIIGTANVARAVLPVMQRQQAGNLVVVGSVLGEVSVPYMSAYVTAKWGMHGLVRTLQQEARATRGVHVSLIKPGSIDTPIYQRAATYVGRQGSPPPPVRSTDGVVGAVFRAVEHGSRQLDVGIANPVMRLGFRVLPFAYDRLVGPLAKVFATHGAKSEATPGNVLRPSEEL